MNTCRNCSFGDQPTGYCAIDGKNIKDQFWQPCDRYNYEPGCDVDELPEYLAIKMVSEEPELFKNSRIEIKYDY